MFFWGGVGLVSNDVPRLHASCTTVVGESGERAIAATLVSAALLIAAHVRNFRLCRSRRVRARTARTPS